MRRLVVTVPKLTREQKREILDAAERHGFEALMYETDEEALPAVAEAEIVFGNSPSLARRAPGLRWLCTPSAGVNTFTGPGVFASPDAALSNSSGAYGVTIAEHIVMVTLEMLRRQPEYDDIVRGRGWKRDLVIKSIRGSRVALLGTGDIGQEAAKRLRGFAPSALVGVNRRGRNPGNLFDRVATLDALDALLPETDIVILSLPGTAQTAHVLDARRLDLLPEGSLIVNVGRGAAIDQAALEARLRANRLRAALDVFEAEPLPPEDPLWSCPNLLITPHVAGNMTLAYTLERIVDMFLEDFENYCAGRPLLRRVDLDRGY